MSIGPSLKVKWSVTAYNESWGGYGDYQSRDFDNEADAIEYARTREDHLKPVKVWKTVTMEPSTTPVEF